MVGNYTEHTYRDLPISIRLESKVRGKSLLSVISNIKLGQSCPKFQLGSSNVRNDVSLLYML